MSRTIAVLTIALAAALGLTGCTGGSPAPAATSSPAADAPGDDGQSVKEACSLVQDTIEKATADVESIGDEDPSAAVEAMDSAADELTAASSEITNDEVAALLPSLQEMFRETADLMEAIVGGDLSKVDDMTELGKTFQKTTDSFQALCLS